MSYNQTSVIFQKSCFEVLMSLSLSVLNFAIWKSWPITTCTVWSTGVKRSIVYNCSSRVNAQDFKPKVNVKSWLHFIIDKCTPSLQIPEG